MNGDVTDIVVFLTVDQVKVLHAQAISRFTSGESMTLRNAGRLEAAIMQPQQTFDGQYLHKSLHAMAAAYACDDMQDCWSRLATPAVPAAIPCLRCRRTAVS